MRGLLTAVCLMFAGLPAANAHVVTQIPADWKGGEPWELEVLFDAGYAVPEWRNDTESPAPTRSWLVAMGESGWAALRREAERYLRECLKIRANGRAVDWQVHFIDFEQSPPAFPELLNDGAYFRMKITGDRLDDDVEMVWEKGSRPSFVLKLPGENAGYLTLAPGETVRLPSPGSDQKGLGPWLESFRQGFLHVLPLGLDHVLFVIGLFFYQRKWRPLLTQSLAFTAAHTVTLGLAAAGILQVGGNWVEPLIALSLAVIALQNLRPAGISHARLRLGIVFGFGLIHGLGFAGALSAWIKPGDGFLGSLFFANLGVEAAQACLLAAAWCLTLRWHRRKIYQNVRSAACWMIAVTGVWWACQRWW